MQKKKKKKVPHNELVCVFRFFVCAKLSSFRVHWFEKKKEDSKSNWFLIPSVFNSSRCQNLTHKFKHFRALFQYLARF